MYIYQLKDWPKFKWDHSCIINILSEIRHLQGRLIGEMSSLGFKLQDEATLETLTEDALKTSAIEGEDLNKERRDFGEFMKMKFLVQDKRKYLT